MSSSIKEQINEDLKIAMKARDTDTTTVLRSLLSALKYAAIEDANKSAGDDLDEPAAVAVIRKQIKQRQDSFESFVKGDRKDLADKEASEIATLEKYLPASLGPGEIIALVEAAIAEAGATTKKDMGGVMKILQEKAAGRVDNKILSQEVMKRLA